MDKYEKLGVSSLFAQGFQFHPVNIVYVQVAEVVEDGLSLVPGYPIIKHLEKFDGSVILRLVFRKVVYLGLDVLEPYV